MRAVTHAGQVFVQGEDFPLAAADALKKAVAAMADVVVQGQQQKARVRADAAHPVIVKGQNPVRSRSGADNRAFR